MDLLEGVRRDTKLNATRITDYGLLQRYVEAWAEGRGHYSLVVLGRSGILKSSLVKSVLGKRDCLYVEGDTGPLALYRDLYLKVNLPVVLDDITIKEPLRPILQSLWDNYDVHRLRWATAKPLVVYTDGKDDDDIMVDDDADDEDAGNVETSGGQRGGQKITLPTSFDTRSRCCVLTNTIDRLSRMGALLDRAYIIEFDPPVLDVLDRASPFVEAEVMGWAKQHARLLPNLSIRDLMQAGTDKRTGMPWETMLRNRYLNPKSKLGAYLEVMRLDTAAERVERWMQLTGMDRATYFRVQQAYRKQFPAKNLPRGRAATLRLKQRTAASHVAKSQPLQHHHAELGR